MAKAVTSKSESLTVRVPVDLMAELRSEARESQTSVGSVMVNKTRAASPPLDIGPVVYFLRAGEGGPVKIGWSKRLSSRIGEIQTGSPVRLDLIRTISCESWVELWLHDQFSDNRLVGEWFVFDDEMLTITPPPEKPVTALNRPRTPLRIRCIKISDEMWEGWRSRSGAVGLSITAMIIERMEAPIVVDDTFAVLRDEIAILKQQLANRPPLEAIASQGVTSQERDESVYHPSGPVLSSAVPPSIMGEITWSGLKTKGKAKP